MRGIKVLPIVLPPDTYACLERQARAAERDPIQQARWLIKQALGAEESAHLTIETQQAAAMAAP